MAAKPPNERYMSRRQFLRFVGVTGVSAMVAPFLRQSGQSATALMSPITVESPLLGAPPVPAHQASGYIIERGSIYPPAEIAAMVASYWTFGMAVGINPLLAIAQSIVETSAKQSDGRWWPWSSWWAQEPRRNPAGLGVTGATQRQQPYHRERWTWDRQAKEWREGLSFVSWEQAIQAHLGHLLGYALRDEEMNRAQYAMSRKSPRLALLPPSYRGSATTLQGLNGRWAVPGETYAEQIASVAQRIVMWHAHSAGSAAHRAEAACG